MVEKNKYLHGVWKHHWLFIGAASACCAGVGALWKFPGAVAGPDASLVVILYLAFLLLLGWPLLLAEVVLGRRARQSPIGTMRYLIRESQLDQPWRCIGWLGIVGGIFVASWCVPLAIWSSHYFVDMAVGVLQGQTLNRAIEHYQGLVSKSADTLWWSGAFVLAVVAVLAGGVVRKGRALRHLVAVLGSLLLLALMLSVANGAWSDSYAHLLQVSWQEVSTGQLLHAAEPALMLATLTLMVGAGAMMTYGAYVPERYLNKGPKAKRGARTHSVAKSVLLIVLVAGLTALLVNLVIWAALFAVPGMEPTSGRELMFITLPASFSNMTQGLFLGSLFYLFVTLAVWGAVVSLLEPAVAWLVESTRCNRLTAAVLVGSGCFALVAVSMNTYSLHPVDSNYYGMLEASATVLLLPLVGFLIALLVGWRLNKSLVREMLYDESKTLFIIWYSLLRYISPLALVIILSFGFYRLFE